jgi:hypothetical protein
MFGTSACTMEKRLRQSYQSLHQSAEAPCDMQITKLQINSHDTVVANRFLSAVTFKGKQMVSMSGKP